MRLPIPMIFEQVIEDEILNNFYLNNNCRSALVFEIFAEIVDTTAVTLPVPTYVYSEKVLFFFIRIDFSYFE